MELFHRDREETTQGERQERDARRFRPYLLAIPAAIHSPPAAKPVTAHGSEVPLEQQSHARVDSGKRAQSHTRDFTPRPGPAPPDFTRLNKRGLSGPPVVVQYRAAESDWAPNFKRIGTLGK